MSIKILGTITDRELSHDLFKIVLDKLHKMVYDSGDIGKISFQGFIDKEGNKAYNIVKEINDEC